MESKSELVTELRTQLINGEVDPNTLREAQVVVRDAKEHAKPRLDESELVVKGTLRPDRRLGGDDHDLDMLILRSARRKFRIGEPPFNPNETSY